MSHRDHVQLAWLYLRREPLLDALTRFTVWARGLAAVCGRPDKYNETLTWGYVILINERMERAGREKDWEAFAAANPDLFEWPGTILQKYYDPETLESDLARRTFLLPFCSRDGSTRKP